MTTPGPTDRDDDPAGVPTDQSPDDGVGTHPDPDALGDLDDGLLEPNAAAQMEEHLRRCRECSALAAGMAEVRALLADQPLPELPADVTARLDAALAGAAAGRRQAGPLSTSPAGATVLPIGAGTPSRRRGGSDLRTRRQVRSEDRSDRRARTVPRVLAAAAALLVVGGTATVISQQLGADSGGDMATSQADGGEEGASAVPAPSALAVPEPPVLATGTDYQRDTLTEQARSLIVRVEGVNASGASPGSGARTDSSEPPAGTSSDAVGTPDPTAGGLPTAGVAEGLLGTTEGLAGCLEELGVPDGTPPAVVDIALFEGREAALVAVPSRGGDAYEVWVVARDCRPGDDGLLSFTPVPRP